MIGCPCCDAAQSRVAVAIEKDCDLVKLTRNDQRDHGSIKAQGVKDRSKECRRAGKLSRLSGR